MSDRAKARILDEMFDVANETPINGAALNWLLVAVAKLHGIPAPKHWPGPVPRRRAAGFRVGSAARAMSPSRHFDA